MTNPDSFNLDSLPLSNENKTNKQGSIEMTSNQTQTNDQSRTKLTALIAADQSKYRNKLEKIESDIRDMLALPSVSAKTLERARLAELYDLTNENINVWAVRLWKKKLKEDFGRLVDNKKTSIRSLYQLRKDIDKALMDELAPFLEGDLYVP